MQTYQQLNSRPASDFLNPDNFVTTYDKLNDAYRITQYEKGLAARKEYKSIFIGANGTWGAHTHTGGLVTSYEGIGYHANTADLLRGFLDSDIKIVVYRNSEEGTKEFTIKP